MSKNSRRPYDPYWHKQNIRVPYTRYSRAAIKRQNRAMRWTIAGALIPAFGAMILAGIAQDAASAALKTELYRVFIPLTAILAAILFFILGFLNRRAHKESWFCIYSAVWSVGAILPRDSPCTAHATSTKISGQVPSSPTSS